MLLRIRFLAITTLVSFSLHAQDKIYETDGSVIDAKIKSVGTKTVSYVRFDNQAGPEYIISKTVVEKIVYQNGNVDKFDDADNSSFRSSFPFPPMWRRPLREKNEDAKDKTKYGQSVVAVAPLQFTENGLGFSVSYERAIDKDGIITFYLPAILTFNLDNSTYQNAAGNTVNGNEDMMFYAMPGIKIYPTGCYGPVKYAIGPSFVVATGQQSGDNYNSGTGTYGYSTQNHFMLGMVVNNSLNINPTPHIYLGLEFGFGFTYLNRVGGINQDTNGLVQGSFKIGYRF